MVIMRFFFLELGVVYACELPLCLAGYKHMPSWPAPYLFYISFVVFSVNGVFFFLTYHGYIVDHHEEGRSSKWVFLFFNFNFVECFLITLVP